MRNRLIAAAAALLLAAACDGGTGPASTTAAPEETGTSTPPTTAAETTTTTLLPGTEELPEEIRAELGELIEITEEVRGLEFMEQPNVVVVSNEELARRVRDQLAEDLEELPADEALYRLLGLIDDDTDLEQLYTDLYSEQVAGYYDGDARELVVPRAEEGFTALQRATLVHELTHALTDQHYRFNDRYTALIDEDRYDEAAAFQALIEGDATLAELLYLQRLTTEEQAAFFQESFGIDQTVFQSAPRFIRDSLVFPYDSGFLFVERLYRTGGFAAIADAYASPPASTEQIIDPEDYPADAPIEVELETLTFDGYELEYQSTWGELSFALMFDQVLDTDPSDVAAGGWGGDTYQVHFDGENVVLVLYYRGDAATDAEELRQALHQYVTTAMAVGDPQETERGTAFRGDDAAWISVDGANLLFVAVSDPALLDTVVADALAAAEADETPDTTTVDTAEG